MGKNAKSHLQCQDHRQIKANIWSNVNCCELSSISWHRVSIDCVHIKCGIRFDSTFVDVLALLIFMKRMVFTVPFISTKYTENWLSFACEISINFNRFRVTADALRLRWIQTMLQMKNLLKCTGINMSGWMREHTCLSIIHI